MNNPHILAPLNPPPPSLPPGAPHKNKIKRRISSIFLRSWGNLELDWSGKEGPALTAVPPENIKIAQRRLNPHGSKADAKARSGPLQLPAIAKQSVTCFFATHVVFPRSKGYEVQHLLCVFLWPGPGSKRRKSRHGRELQHPAGKCVKH